MDRKLFHEGTFYAVAGKFMSSTVRIHIQVGKVINGFGDRELLWGRRLINASETIHEVYLVQVNDGVGRICLLIVKARV